MQARLTHAGHDAGDEPRTLHIHVSPDISWCFPRRGGHSKYGSCCLDELLAVWSSLLLSVQSRHADHLAQTRRPQAFSQVHGEVQVIIEYSNSEVTLFQVAEACAAVSVIARHRDGLTPISS